jgi:methionyl-tRNA synthetase
MKKLSERAKKFRKISNMLQPVKYFATVLYAILPQFMRPIWCQILADENKDNFDPTYCNDEANTFTNSNLPKYDRVVTIPIHVVLLLTLVGF